MKTATILIQFRDKVNRKVIYKPGDKVEFDEDRVAALAARGLVEIAEDKPAETTDSATSNQKPAKGKRGKAKKESTVAPGEEQEAKADDANADNAELASDSETIIPDKDK